MSDAPRLIIAAGGTGGHMFPAQALAEAMVRKGWEVTLSTDDRGARFAGGFPHTVAVEQVRSATFSRGGALGKITAPLKIAGGILGAVFKMIRRRPAIVVGFGGYPTIPALSAAWLLRVPRMIHEQNGILGRVNTVFAKRVQAVACGAWPTELPEGVDGIHTGNPVRAAILARAAAPYPEPDAGMNTILVIGGSQGASILSDVVPTALSLFPDEARERLRVAHQAREEDLTDVSDTYAGAEITADVRPFFQDVPQRMAEAQLVIARAGASSVAEIGVIGRPSILIPYAAATGDHQTANARGLVSAGAAIMIPESALAPEALAEQIQTILATPGAARTMAENALTYGRPDATDRLVALVEELTGDVQA